LRPAICAGPAKRKSRVISSTCGKGSLKREDGRTPSSISSPRPLPPSRRSFATWRA
jgi:hypothetical protein